MKKIYQIVFLGILIMGAAEAKSNLSINISPPHSQSNEQLGLFIDICSKYIENLDEISVKALKENWVMSSSSATEQSEGNKTVRESDKVWVVSSLTQVHRIMSRTITDVDGRINICSIFDGTGDMNTVLDTYIKTFDLTETKRTFNNPHEFNGYFFKSKLSNFKNCLFTINGMEEGKLDPYLISIMCAR